MVSVSSVALFLAWGMMAVVQGDQLLRSQRVIFRLAAVAEAPTVEKLWQASFSDVAKVNYQSALANLLDTPGVEVPDLATRDVNNPGLVSLFSLTSDGQQVDSGHRFSSSQSFQGPIAVDWDGDGKNEIALVVRNSDPRLLLVGGQGQIFSTESVAESRGFWWFSHPAVVDLNSDGLKDFVFSAYKAGREVVFAFSGTGGLLWKYTIGSAHKRAVNIDNECTEGVITPDFDRDGKYDVSFLACDCVTGDDIAGAEDPKTTEVVANFPFLDQNIREVLEVEVGEDNVVRVNGQQELCGTAVYRLDHEGNLVWRKFVSDRNSTGTFVQVAAADFTHDGKLEIVANPFYMEGEWGQPVINTSQLIMLNHQGEIVWQKNFLQDSKFNVFTRAIANVTPTVNGEGNPAPEIIVCEDQKNGGARIKMVSAAGSFSYLPADQRYYNCTPISVADFNGDFKPDIAVYYSDDRLHFFDSDGAWQLVSPDKYSHSSDSGSFADLDGDGTLEGVFRPRQTCDNATCATVEMQAFTFPQSRVEPYAGEWIMHKHDLHRTSWYEYADPSAFPVMPKPEITFRRGDADVNGAIDITDPIVTLQAVYLQGPPLACADAADTNDDGVVDVRDAEYSMRYQFGGGIEPPAPGPVTRGPDATEDELGCQRYP